MQRIWYVAYGSNLSRERFCYYLRGGRPMAPNATTRVSGHQRRVTVSAC